MKQSRAFLSAIALASATLLSQTAFAGPIASTTTDVTFVDNQALIREVLTGGNAGATFTNRYQFTFTQSGNFDAALSLGDSANKSLNITGFTLYDSTGNIVEQSSSGAWMIDYDNLAAGSYYLEVAGGLKTNAAGKYSANLSFGPAPIAEVPEPGSLALMLGGLGLIGVAAVRRKKA